MATATKDKKSIPEAVENSTKSRYSDFLAQGFQDIARQTLKDLDRWTGVIRSHYTTIEAKIDSIDGRDEEKDKRICLGVWADMSSIWIRKTNTLDYAGKASLEKELKNMLEMEDVDKAMEKAAEIWKMEMGHMVERRTAIDPTVEGADHYNNYYKDHIYKKQLEEDYKYDDTDHRWWLAWDVMMKSWRSSLDMPDGAMPPPPFVNGMDERSTKRNPPPPPPLEEDASLLGNADADQTRKGGSNGGGPRTGGDDKALKSMTAERDELARKLKEAQDALSTQESRHKAQIDEWNENVGRARLAQTTAHQKEVDKLKAAGRELGEKLEVSRRTLKDNQTKTEQAHGAKVKDLNKRIVSANIATAEEKGKKDAAEAKASGLQKTVDEQRKALDIAERVLEDKQRKNEELSTAISNATREMVQRDLKIRELGEELAQRERSNAQLTGDIAGLQDNLRDANRTIEQLRERELAVSNQEAANRAEKERLEKWSSAVDNQKTAQESISKSQERTKHEQATTAKEQAETAARLSEERTALDRLRAQLEKKESELSDRESNLATRENELNRGEKELSNKAGTLDSERERLAQAQEDWKRRMALMEGINDMNLAKWHTAEQVMLHGSPTAKRELINQKGSEDYLTARRKEDGETIAHFIADVGSEDNLMALIGRGKEILGIERYIDGKTVADIIRERGSDDVQKALDQALEQGAR